ncbi:MAG: homocysteine S-methyltransferase family protein [Deltaproteobacteria bacterium]|nr:homocysteine S-methyltransferase family protein [Deltaproteobacteria bacterium]
MSVPDWIRDLIADGPVLLDGAWGTELQARGLAPGEMPDFWNLSRPDRVEEVARAYVEAGSQIILTNTFRANRIAAGSHADVDRIEEVNRAGVEISQRASAGKSRVFASIGPSGKLLLGGGVAPEELLAAFDEQARALAKAAPDALIVETMTDLAEAEIAITAAKATGLPVVACMVFDSGKRKDRTMMGVTASEAAEALTGFGADIVGANCGNGIEGYIPICAAMSAATDRPIWIKANAGIPEFANGEFRYTTTPEKFVSYRGALIDAGANFIGGCCGTSPSFIRALAAAKQAS